MIHAGSVVASVLSQGRSSWTTFKPFRNDHEKRDFVACGAAAGVAAAFGAPVGGALFALEEGATHWNDFLTWRTFVAAMVSKFTLNLVLSGIYGTWGVLDTPASIAFGSFRDQDKAYTVQEIPLFIVLGAVGGIVGGIPTPPNPLFLGRFAPVFRRFSAVILCCPASWRRDGENGRKMAKNGRNLGEKRARNSDG